MNDKKIFNIYFFVVICVSLAFSFFNFYGEIIVLTLIIIPNFIKSYKLSVNLRIEGRFKESKQKQKYINRFLFGVIGVVLNIASRIIC